MERLYRSINACIRTYVRTDQRLWDTKISEVEFVINNTWHSSAGFTPYRILFGHDIIVDGDEHRREVDTADLSEISRNEQRLKVERLSSTSYKGT